jgi:hypothetical protein
VTRVLGRLYEALLWRWTTGRPRTYVMRSLAQDYPLMAWPIVAAVIAGSLVASAWTVITFGWVGIPALAFGYLLMTVVGHAYWDTAGAHIKTVSDFARRKP